MATRRNPKEVEWPLGTYLRDQRGKMSIREAARRADISESRWRQVEAGFIKMGTDLDGKPINMPIHTRAETVVKMCRAISADARKGLELGGHNPDDYLWLLESPASMLGEDDDSREWFTSLSREDREQVLSELQRLHTDTALGKGKPKTRRRA